MQCGAVGEKLGFLNATVESGQWSSRVDSDGYSIQIGRYFSTVRFVFVSTRLCLVSFF